MEELSYCDKKDFRKAIVGSCGYWTDTNDTG
jgi:hypothetical protein